MFLLVGGEGLRHVVCRRLVHVAGGVEVALRVVGGPVGDAFFGVCAVSRFAEVLCAPVACGCVFVARRVGAIFVGEGRLAWVFFSCFCLRIRVRARACLFVLCGV